MHDEVSETEHIRANLAIERSIAEGCDILLDVNQVLCRQGQRRRKKICRIFLLFSIIFRQFDFVDWRSNKIDSWSTI